MAITNRDRVGRALDLLRTGLAPYIERELTSQFRSKALEKARAFVGGGRLETNKPIAEWDAAALLRLMQRAWKEIFQKTLGRPGNALVNELYDARNSWAHQKAISSEDVYRTLDSIYRLLSAVSAPEIDEVDKMRMEIHRVRFEEQLRNERRKVATAAIESQSMAGLRPWREVVSPHRDVASGRYQLAEFAADLWQVHLGEGTPEYGDPVEFFRRTFLTESLQQLLANAIRRLGGSGGDPVVQLQTNFGGGKTHAMLALYHLFSGIAPGELAGIESVLPEKAVKKLPEARRVVLVGNRISPGNPAKKPDGTVVRTLWGELAWQLGGEEAFARIAADDQHATSPGDALRELFNDYGPCLILIDEWVAYARQLHDRDDLPAGSFETQFTFAQTLTESAKLADRCQLVISLPTSESSPSAHTIADDMEVGGERGRAALERLRNAVGRLEISWRPATAEEGFEIVRRRLFAPLVERDQFVARDAVARAFADLYQDQKEELPPECSEPGYETRIRAAYPIHPEIFDRLYGDWSTLLKFQRTRGVLRLMAAVIHNLWEKGDRHPLILPAHISIGEPRVRDELTHYLSDNWVPVIEKDVDGPSSLPLRLDSAIPNLGKYSACRRVARAIYLGSAPLTQAAHRGIEDRRVKLGCMMPGESPAVFVDALRRLASAATYLYEDGSRYWYATQPTVTKLAEDRAEQLKREDDKVVQEIEKRLAIDLRQKGDFNRIHPTPPSGHDIPDDYDARLVVLRVEHPYSRDEGNAAEVAAQAMLESRGNAPRLFRNTLIFLAADKGRLQDLDEAVRRYLAWESVLAEKEKLNLDPYQVKQAEARKAAADSVVVAQIPETYQWLLVPSQATPQEPVKWSPGLKLSGHEPLAVRASKKLRSAEQLITDYAATTLRMELDRVPLWRGDHVEVRQLVEDFARYPYLPRLKDPSVLLAAIRDGVALLTWEQDSFAYADSYDEAAGRYRGLRAAQNLPMTSTPTGLLVKPAVARRQMDAESVPPPITTPIPGGTVTAGGPQDGLEPQPPAPAETKPTRFHGTVDLDPTRVGRDASRIADEVIAHLSGLVGSTVKVSLEIEAQIPDGAPDHVVRTVTENSRTLKFTSQGFERE